jgi:hypothetical protein
VLTRLTTVKSVAFMPKNEIGYDRRYFDQGQKALRKRCCFQIIRVRQARHQLSFQPLGDQSGHASRRPKRTARAPDPPAVSRPEAPERGGSCAGNNTRVSIAAVGMNRLPLNQNGESGTGFSCAAFFLSRRLDTFCFWQTAKV